MRAESGDLSREFDMTGVRWKFAYGEALCQGSLNT